MAFATQASQSKPGFVVLKSYDIADAFQNLGTALQIIDPETFPTPTRAKRSIRKGTIEVNGDVAKTTTLSLRVGDRVCVLGRLQDEGSGPSHAARFASEELVRLGLDGPRRPSVIYEDDHFAVVCKPQGMLTQGAASLGDGVTPALQFFLPALLRPSPLPGSMRNPVVAHRLDLTTGGLVLAAKSKAALQGLSRTLAGRAASERYLAVLDGYLGPAGEGGTIRIPMFGKLCVTDYHIESVVGSDAVGWLTTASLFARTGRKHQLRRHVSMLGCPVLFDDSYSIGVSDRFHMIQAKRATTGEGREESEGDEHEGAADVAGPSTVSDDAEAPHAIKTLADVDFMRDEHRAAGSVKDVAAPSIFRSWPEGETRYPCCLWAVDLSLPHPVEGRPMRFTIEEPAYYKEIRATFDASFMRT